MKNRISFLIVVFMTIFIFTHFTFAIRSTGRDCTGSFFGYFWEGTSDNEIIEKFEWRGTNTIEPWMESVGYQDATIFGRIKAYQRTFGRGTVGVVPQGSVSGPSFSLTLPKEYNLTGVGGLSGTWDTTSMTTKESDTTDEPGTYTLTGSADFMAVGGGGGIKVDNLGGVTFSGTVAFNLTKSADTVTHTLSVKQERPKSYECAHENCTVMLPNRYHHRQPCQEKRWRSASKTEITCNRLYYRCQESTCPLDYLHVATHACGNHKDTKQGVRLNKSSHELQASCPISITQDGTNVYCRVSNFYACEDPAHTCDFPPPSNNGDGNGGSGSPNNGGSTTTPTPAPEPTPPPPNPNSATCANGHPYNPNNSAENNRHRTRTCRYSECGNTWEKCVSNTPKCNKPWRKARGKYCWAR